MKCLHPQSELHHLDNALRFQPALSRTLYASAMPVLIGLHHPLIDLAPQRWEHD